MGGRGLDYFGIILKLRLLDKADVLDHSRFGVVFLERVFKRQRTTEVG